MIVNAANLSHLFKAYNAAFQNAFAGAQPMWNRVATEVPSSTSQNDYGWLGDMPGLREWIGDRHVHGIEQFDYSLKNKKFELTVGVPRDKIQDDQYGVYTPMMAHMGYEAARHPDTLNFALLKDAFSTACYDGQNFIDSSHPVGSGTVSNTGGGSGSPWFLLDTGKMLKPLIWQTREPYTFTSMVSADDEQVFMRDEYRYGVHGRGNVGFGFWQMAYGSKQTLDASAYAAARAAMMAFKGEHGRPLGIMPDLLVVAPTNEQAARNILLAERDSNGATNTYRATAELLVSPYLA